MARRILPFQYEKEKTNTGMTALGGLPVYLAQVVGLSKSIDGHMVSKGDPPSSKIPKIVPKSHQPNANAM